MNNQKGSATVILLVVLVVVVAAVLVYFAFLKKPGEVAVSPTPTPTKTANPTVNWKSDTESTVSVFMENINTRGYSDNINVAFDKLTSDAQTIVRAHSPNTTLAGLASGLAYFVGIQEAPNKGASIVSSQKLDDGTVRISTKWNYSGSSSIIKIFTLVFENSQWKINKVQ